MKYNFILLLSLGLMMTSCESGSQQNTETKSESTAEQQASAEEKNKAKSIEDWKNEIKNNPEWLAQVVDKAKKLNRSVEDQLEDDAKWSFNEAHKSMKEIKNPKTLEDVMNNMYLNADWISQIEEKAKKNGVSLKNQMESEAKWILENTSK